MIDVHLTFRMRRSEAAQHGRPRTPRGRVIAIIVVVSMLTFGQVVLGVSPTHLLRLVT